MSGRVSSRSLAWIRSRPSVVFALLAFALAFVADVEVLSYWFTGPDTLTLIETSRIVGYESAIASLTKPLMHGTNFVALTGLFYRPVSNLSYAVDYWVWGTDPFGYHLTDLVFHATAAALVVVLLAAQFGPRRSGGPPTSAAPDTGRKSSIRTVGGARIVSLSAAALAGGLFALHPLSVEVVPTPARRHDVLATLFTLASLWALARALRAERTPRRRFLTLALCAYALALGSKEVSAIVPALAVTWTVLDVYGRRGRLWETVRETFAVGLGYGVVSVAYVVLRLRVLGGIGGYVGPFGGVKDTPVPEIATQYVLSLLYPVDVFDVASRVDFSATVPAVLAVGVCLLAVGIAGAGGVRRFLRSATGRLATFHTVWLCLPLPLIARVGEYSPWTGYIALVPVASLTALVVTAGARAAYRSLVALARGRTGSETLRTALGAVSGLGSLALAVLLVFALVSVSPLFHPYDGWGHASDVTEQALTGAEENTQNLPQNALVNVEGLPAVTTLSSPTAEPRAKSTRYFWAHSVRSWIRLRRPESHLSTFTFGRTVAIGNESLDVRAETTRRPNAPALLRFRYEPRAANRTSSARPGNDRAGRDDRTGRRPDDRTVRYSIRSAQTLGG